MENNQTTRQIKKLLVANRGEIAVRIFKTCRKLGIKTVAIASAADRYALHTRGADQSYILAESEASKTYLDIAKVIEILQRSGADAVHPGYGFLSENSKFAAAVEAAGAIFLGPTAAQMTQLGDKEQAKIRAQALNIPVLESERIENFALPTLVFPLMIKARAGGGGRGMRIVNESSEFSAAVQSASREALAFFNDGTLFVERFIARARHVEVQLFGDGSGAVSVIGDRDCTVQRRHQKVLEEAPALELSAELRANMHRDAQNLLASVAYRGAATAEFLVCGAEYFFLEVNTRLQVEHPVTEAVTGLDLVLLQIKIGEGAKLAQLLPQEIQSFGHAIELRICAEKPAQNFTPATGKIAWVRKFESNNARFDCGFGELDTVSHFYDSLIGKIIVHAPTRAAALAKCEQILATAIVLGIDTNQRFLNEIITHPDFIAGTHFTRWVETIAISADPSFALAIKKLQLNQTLNAALNPNALTRIGFSNPQIVLQELSSQESGKITGSVPETIRTAGGDFIFYDGKGFQVIVTTPELRGSGKSSSLAGSLAGSSLQGGPAVLSSVIAPLPGKILEILTVAGRPVKAGEVLMTFESMKMEHSIKAHISGELLRMCVAPLQVVEAGAVVAEIKPLVNNN